MRSVSLSRGDERWLVKYDEETAALTVEGPAPMGRQIHTWLSTPSRVIDGDTGNMVLVRPADSWEFLVQAIDVGLCVDMALTAAVADEEEEA